MNDRHIGELVASQSLEQDDHDAEAVFNGLGFTDRVDRRGTVFRSTADFLPLVAVRATNALPSGTPHNPETVELVPRKQARIFRQRHRA